MSTPKYPGPAIATPIFSYWKKLEGAMHILSREKSKVLAEQHGWSLTIAEGYVDGEACRRRGKAPPAHALVGKDEYSEGFRAGFYLRNPAST